MANMLLRITLKAQVVEIMLKSEVKVEVVEEEIEETNSDKMSKAGSVAEAGFESLLFVHKLLKQMIIHDINV